MFLCQQCYRSFNSFEDLYKHSFRSHSDVVCENCRLIFENHSGLITHFKTTEHINTFQDGRDIQAGSTKSREDNPLESNATPKDLQVLSYPHS